MMTRNSRQQGGRFCCHGVDTMPLRLQRGSGRIEGSGKAKDRSYPACDEENLLSEK